MPDSLIISDEKLDKAKTHIDRLTGGAFYTFFVLIVVNQVLATPPVLWQHMTMVLINFTAAIIYAGIGSARALYSWLVSEEREQWDSFLLVAVLLLFRVVWDFVQLTTLLPH